MTGFYPFGPPEPHGYNHVARGRGKCHGHSHGMAGPAEMVAMMREQGVIPPFVRDEDIMVAGVTLTGEVKFLGSPGDMQDEISEWRPGDVLPHTARDFSDPPYGDTPQEWRDKLIGLVNSVDDPDEFRMGLMYYLGRDLMYSHGVPVDPAVEGAGEFADWVYDTFRTRVT